ncbi:MAG: hypothetical protein SF182_01585 [Deltaproteobacteria bacterium]|nr:hypothetical protein [Deltaproteobacteria bacterium]
MTTQRRTCPCGEPLVPTAEIEPGTPRRIWRCRNLHEVVQRDTDALPPTPPPAPPRGQMGLL